MEVNPYNSHLEQIGRDIGVQLGKEIEKAETELAKQMAKEAVKFNFESVQEFYDAYELAVVEMPVSEGVIEKTAYIVADNKAEKVKLAYIVEGGYRLNGFRKDGALDVEVFAKVYNATEAFSFTDDPDEAIFKK